jgi:4-amino-4-deoxy-L-arabinose transferase-like glycosyltransferase
MSSTQQTTALPAAAQLSAEPEVHARTGRRVLVAPRHVALAGVLALSALLNAYSLPKNEYGNTFYSAAVHSMLRSAHDFFFVSFDPGGLITVDKPPLGLWVQGLSAELFGFHPLSLLLPEALIGVLTVAVMYRAIAPRLGPAAGIAGALALAVYPSFVAISRENGVDSLLILLMTLACAVGLRAIESGRLRTLLGCAVLVGLAFNTKTLAAYLVLPGLGLGYLVCAPGTLMRRTAQLAAAGAMLALVSASWSAVVELTPASQRPFVGGSTDNTELNLTFAYNGFGRVEGQLGGPGQIPLVERFGSLAALEQQGLRRRAARAARAAAARGEAPPAKRTAPAATAPSVPPPTPPLPSATQYSGHMHNPTSFGGTTGPFRLLKVELGGQAGWMLPFALFGMLALALLWLGGRGEAPPERRNRRDMRLAVLIVLGGWFAVEGIVLSFGKGIVHPYYVSALAPGVAAMVGAGAAAFLAPGALRRSRLALGALAIATTVPVQLQLLRDEPHYMRWLFPMLALGAALGVLALLLSRRLRRPAMALTLCLLLLAPAAFAATTWEFPVEGTFPAAGPRAAASPGPLGIDPRGLQVTEELIAYVDAHHPGTRWDMLTEASDTAAPALLLGHDAGAMGGYSGSDPALDGPSLARLVTRGEARYVVLGGAYASRGGNAASTAVIKACEVVPGAAWQPPPVDPNALLLYDCAGRARALRGS